MILSALAISVKNITIRQARRSFEITSSSDFIQQPNPLLPAVQQYLKIVTDERDTCRRKNESGTCLESDHVFDLSEQYNPIIDNYPQVTNVEVDAGHVEIVGYKQVAPRKLLSILQQQGILSQTADLILILLNNQ